MKNDVTCEGGTGRKKDSGRNCTGTVKEKDRIKVKKSMKITVNSCTDLQHLSISCQIRKSCKTVAPVELSLNSFPARMEVLSPSLETAVLPKKKNP